MNFSWGVGLKSNEKVVGYPYNSHATTVTESTSCLEGWCYSLQGSHLSKISGDLYTPEACITSLVAKKVNQ